MALARFMATPTGRIARIVVGFVLVAAGLMIGGGGIALAVVGLVPIAAGVLNVCLIAPLLHVPFSGRSVR